MEDDLKIGKVEHLSKHSMDFDWLEENSEEIPSVALLSPACFYFLLTPCPLVLMGGWAEGQACADPGARTSGNYLNIYTGTTLQRTFFGTQDASIQYFLPNEKKGLVWLGLSLAIFLYPCFKKSNFWRKIYVVRWQTPASIERPKLFPTF